VLFNASILTLDGFIWKGKMKVNGKDKNFEVASHGICQGVVLENIDFGQLCLIQLPMHGKRSKFWYWDVKIIVQLTLLHTIYPSPNHFSWIYHSLISLIF
jgi:hypothetical protein